MDGDRLAGAESADQLKEQRGEAEGVANPTRPDRADDASFYPDAEMYPTGRALPPTGDLDAPAPTDALHPDEERTDDDRPGDAEPRQAGRATGGGIDE
jgi:hypothetical protein